jgi:hypothetical protein
MFVLKSLNWKFVDGVGDATAQPDTWLESDGVDYSGPDGSGGNALAAPNTLASTGAASSIAPLSLNNGGALDSRWGEALPGRAIADGLGSDGATPAQVRQAVNAVGLNVTGQGITVGVLSDSSMILGAPRRTNPAAEDGTVCRRGATMEALSQA